MKRKALTLALCLIGLPVAVHAQTVPADVTTVTVTGEKPNVPRTWFRAETRHFVVYSDASHSAARELLENLERFRTVLLTFSNFADDDETEKFPVWYLSDPGDLARINPEMPDHAVGLYEACENGSQGFAVYRTANANTAALNSATPAPETDTATFEAYARYFFGAHFARRAPLWYVEGYARYFSTVRFDGDSVVVGLPPPALAVFMQGLETRYEPWLDYKDVLIGNDSRSLKRGGTDQLQAQIGARRRARVTEHSPAEIDRFENARLEYEFAARSWLLTHWILSAPERAGKLERYDAALRDGENPLDAFRRLFGYSSAQLDTLLRRHLRTELTAGTMTVKDLAVPEVTFADVPAAAGRLILDDAALRGCPSAAYGRQVLAEARAEAAKAPGNAFAERTLQRAEVLYGDPRAALPALQAGDTGDFETQYLLGRAELAVALTSDDQADYDAADAAFTRAAQLNAKSAPNAFWYYRAQVLDTGQLGPDAAGAAVLAWRLAPEVGTYVFHAALVYAEANDFDTATWLLKRLADDPKPGPWAKPARNWLDRLRTGVSAADILAGIVAGETPDAAWPGQADWTIDSVAEVNEIATWQAEAENNQLRLRSYKGWDEPTNATPQSGQVMPGAEQEKIGEQ